MSPHWPAPRAADSPELGIRAIRVSSLLAFFSSKKKGV